jgi:hypothetical protein
MTDLFTTTASIAIGIYIIVISGFLAFLYSMYKDHRNHKLTLEVIGLYKKTSTMTPRELYQARHFLDSVEGRVKQLYITNALIFIELREKVLQNEGKFTHEY